MTRSFWVRPIALIFFGAVAVIGVWHGNRGAEATLERFDPPQIRVDVAAADWWNRAWRNLPARRNEFRSDSAWPLNVQYAGSLKALQHRLERNGWQLAPPASWQALLRTLDKGATPQTLPVLPASHNGHGDALLMSHAGDTPDTLLVLHLWPAPLRLQPEQAPVWQGTVATLRFEEQLEVFSLWRVQPHTAVALDVLAHDLPGLRQRFAQRRDGNEERVLLLHQGALRRDAD